MQKLFTAAKEYINQNISVIVTDKNKKALFPWKQFQNKIISLEEISQQLSHEKAGGLAVICGAVSGGLEVIDIDTKNDITGSLYDNILSNIPDEILPLLYTVQTKSGGYHLYYRCKEIAGNQKLSVRFATEEEKKVTPHLKQVVLIETRGEAGYVVAPPSDGYRYISGKINVITNEHRAILLDICKSFTEITEEKVIYPTNKADFSQKPWDDYNNRHTPIDLLTSHGWKITKQSGERTFFERPGKNEKSISGDYHSGLNLFKVFSTSTEFETGRGYKPFGVYCLLEHGGDPSQAAKELVRLGYGKPSMPLSQKVKKAIRNFTDAGFSDEQIKEKLIRDHSLSQGDAAETLEEFKAQSGKKILTFWEVDEKGKITIVRTKLANFLLKHGGFSLYFYDPNSTIFKIVREKDGLLEEASTESIKKYLVEYIESLEPLEPFDYGITATALLEILHKGASIYFSISWLEFLKHGKYNFLKDTPNEIFFPFLNGVVCLTKSGIKIDTYKNINRVIWRSQVINFNITIDTDFDPQLSEFNKFLELISGKESDKLNYLYSVIGYCLNKFKDASRPWGIVFAEETEDEQKGGGTGKGILVKSLSLMTKTERVDGKNFKVDKNFAFQRVGLDTRLLVIEDVRKRFDFEAYYSIITEGVTTERKNKDELFINYSESPKIIITTNYTVPRKGEHAKRRQRVFELANYFNSQRTPQDHFGHLLFDGWDEDEWNRFYNLYFFCCQYYLKHSVKEVIASNKIKRKHIRGNYTAEFLEYLEDYLKVSAGVWSGLSHEYTNFLSGEGWEKKDYSIKRFKSAVTEAAEIFDLDIEVRRNRQMNNAHEFKIEIPAGNTVFESVDNTEIYEL